MQQTEQQLPLLSSFNWMGMRMLYWREVLRFLKVWNQTILAPVVNSVIWFAIFTLAFGAARGDFIEGLSFATFIAPGLIMMQVTQNAFANLSSSLVIGKVQGNLVDVLLPPFTADEIVTAYVLGGVTRGVLVGLVTWLALAFFVELPEIHWGYVVLYLLLASLFTSLLGFLGGLWAQQFDQLNVITNYVVAPLSMLSGTFYSIHMLPQFWQTVCHYNPFFYIIDGFRYALTGHSDGNVNVGIAVLAGLSAVLWLASRIVVQKGWRLKT